MTRAERDAWVAALRSGKYRQGQDRLRSESGFCCLGVLCDIKNPEGWRASPITGGWFHGREFMFPDPCVSDIPESIQNQVARLNDNGKSFLEIANWIEANVPVTD